jgi:hypothetical protein
LTAHFEPFGQCTHRCGGRALGDHQRRRVGVAAGDGGHHAGIGDAQAGHAAHAQRRVSTTARVVGAAHAAGAHRVEDGGADVAGQARQFVVGLELHAGLDSCGW